jgi:hypothetical protein
LTDFDWMQDDCDFYGYDIACLKDIQASNPIPPPMLWHKSEAKHLLIEDINNGKHVGKLPQDLNKSKQQYRGFSLKVF